MSKYIIRVEENGEEIRAENTALPQDVKDGLKADSFVLLTYVDDKPGAILVHHITALEIARIICNDGPNTEGILHQAFALAEGMEKAKAIACKYDNPISSLAKMLKKTLEDKSIHQVETEITEHKAAE